jgi:cytochrome c-type biogenesis protein CcmH/NrfG
MKGWYYATGIRRCTLLMLVAYFLLTLTSICTNADQSLQDTNENYNQEALQSPSSKTAPPISSLVGNLEDKLKLNPHDEKGWKLLARSYQFLNQPEKAAWAMQQARRYAQPEASDTLRELLGPALQDRSNDE